MPMIFDVLFSIEIYNENNINKSISEQLRNPYKYHKRKKKMIGKVGKSKCKERNTCKNSQTFSIHFYFRFQDSYPPPLILNFIYTSLFIYFRSPMIFMLPFMENQ